jgi:hypothetical protein
MKRKQKKLPFWRRPLKRRMMKRALWLTSATLVLVLAASAVVAARYGFAETVGGDILVMGPQQAKECEDGGGCAIFSEREFLAALSRILQKRSQSWREES